MVFTLESRHIKAETEKAFLIGSEWFPKSLCVEEDGLVAGNIVPVVLVPRWLKEKKSSLLPWNGPYDYEI